MSKLSIEARLIDFVSKNVDRMNITIRHFARSAGGAFSSIAGHVNGLSSKLRQGIPGGGFFKDLLKFAGVQKLMQALEQSIFSVFNAAKAGSPEVAEKFEQLKGRINQLVTEVGNKLIPVFLQLFDFLLENWESIRYAFDIGISVIKDLFNTLMLSFQGVTLAFKGGALAIATGLSKLGLVSKDTVAGMKEDFLSYADTVGESAEKFKLGANTIASVRSGKGGLGKAPKATVDLFGGDKGTDKNTEIDMVELRKQQLEKVAKEEDAKANYIYQLTKDTAMRKVEAMAEGADKELALNKLKYEQMKMDMLNDGQFHILSAQQKQDALSSIEELGAADRKRILDEESKNRTEKLKQEFNERLTAYSDASASVLSGALTLSSSLQQLDESRAKRKTEKQLKEIERFTRLGYMSQEEAEKKKAEIEAQAERRNKERAKKAQAIARAEALINIAQGITKAIAIGGPLGIITGISVGLAGAAQIAQIEAQEFKEGGVIPGRNTLIRTNEDGRPEYVMNADAVSRIGVGNLDRMNNGGGVPGGSVTIVNNNNYSPNSTINSSQGSKQSFEQMLEQNSEVFFNFFEEKMRKSQTFRKKAGR